MQGRRPSLALLLRDFYGSLSDDVGFEQPLQVIGRAFRSHISGLHSESYGNRSGSLTLSGEVNRREFSGLSEAYSQRWTGQNLWMERSLEGFQRQGYQHGDAIVSGAELTASAYYRHFLKPLDIRHGMGIQVWNDGDLNMAVVSIHRGHRDPGFMETDIQLIGQLRPHIVNAYAIYRRLAKLERELHSLRASFEHSPLGMLALDAGGHVLESNAAAEKLLLARAGIARGREDRLIFASPATQMLYREAMQRMIGPAIPAPESLPLKASSHVGAAHGLVMHLCALPAHRVSGMHQHTRVLAFVAELDGGQRDALAAEIVRRVLGLTPMEARIALAQREHVDAAAIAVALALTVQTVRSHLKSIFRKLHITRSGELLMIVERLVGSVPTA